MLKISKIARHTVVQMAGCTKNPRDTFCTWGGFGRM